MNAKGMIASVCSFMASAGPKRPSLLALTFLVLVMPWISWSAPGTVYLVVGSDTAIWEGMDTSRYHCHYNIDLYTNQNRNAFKVMDPAFRSRFVDSYGQTLKMTWWMMAGQIFRYADNTDVPVPNTMTLHLMKQYHGAAIEQFGDELTLHYHTFAWTNYSGGIPSWVQADTFGECQDDFDYTVAQFLLEEGVYPISFRSGWEWMSTEYQNHLNLILPFSLEANWWSVWAPYHPSVTNYRVAGDGKGWNARCIYMANISQAQMDGMFAQAAAGTDQLACIWAHLPEADFLTNIANVHAKAAQSAINYPAVSFRYCTAVEAMQRWLGTFGEEPPQLEVTQQTNTARMSFLLHTDKPIFQEQPFVGCKDIYNETTVVVCEQTASNTWVATMPWPTNGLSKVAVAVTDASGHLATRILPFAEIPEAPPETNLAEVVVDNVNASVVGSWNTGTSSYDKYGTDYRYKGPGNGSSYLQFTPVLPEEGDYEVWEWHPQGSNRTTNAPFVITYDGGQATCFVNEQTGGGQWNLLGKFHFTSGSSGNVRITDAFADTTQLVLADAVRFVLPSSRLPIVLSPPIDQAVDAGHPVQFQVLAADDESLSYQWRRNGQDIPGATNAFYSIPIVIDMDAGLFDVTISNTSGTTNSPAAILTVTGTDYPPTISLQPQDQEAPIGGTATFTIAAAGPPPLTYMWRFEGQDIPGATGPSYTIEAAQADDAGTYSIAVSNHNGVTISSNARLTIVVPPPPTITVQPESQTVIAGRTLTLSFVASSTAPMWYQWRKSGVALPDRTNATLVISPATTQDAGAYDVVISNTGGAVTSQTAVVYATVVPPPLLSATSDAGQVQIEAVGQGPGAFLIEASTNLYNWRAIMTPPYGQTSLSFIDPAAGSLPRRFYRGRGMLTHTITDFEGFNPGAAVMFQKPSYSGSTASFIDTLAPNSASVSSAFPEGHAGNNVLAVVWTFKVGAGTWLRLTASEGPVLPNPTIDFREGLQFDIFTDRPLYVAFGVRETSTTAAIGANGGNSGMPIEWIGGSSDNSKAPPKGRLVPAGEWTTLRFNIPEEAIHSFTGNGRLESITGKGVFEHLAIVPLTSDGGAQTIYLDNFQVNYIR